MNLMLSDKFLGTNALEKNVEGNLLALTTYSASRSLEAPHSHENTSISFLLSGAHQEQLSGKSFFRVAGDIKIVPAGEVHRCYHYLPGTQKINLELTKQTIKDANIELDSLGSILQKSNSPKFTLLKLFKEIDDHGSHSRISTQLLLQELLDVGTAPTLHSRNPPGWAIKLKQILNDEWATSFELRSLSGILGVHPVTISRYFPLYFGSTMGQYLNGVKVDRALKMIRGSSLTLTEIAYSCGFADQAHFTRTFKAYTGHLPKEYRKL